MRTIVENGIETEYPVGVINWTKFVLSFALPSSRRLTQSA